MCRFADMSGYKGIMPFGPFGSREPGEKTDKCLQACLTRAVGRMSTGKCLNYKENSKR